MCKRVKSINVINYFNAISVQNFQLLVTTLMKPTKCIRRNFRGVLFNQGIPRTYISDSLLVFCLLLAASSLYLRTISYVLPGGLMDGRGFLSITEVSE